MILREDLRVGVPEFSCVSEGEVQLIRQGFGTFSLLAKDEDGDCFQRSHNLNDFYTRMPDFMKLEGHDLYITQNVFRGYNRRELLIHKLCSCYVDLDFYHETNLSPEAMAEQVLEHCESKKIPFPSVIICSGRGLYLKWYLKYSAPAKALTKWNPIQKALVEAFACLWADPRARDASRVLRPIGSWNRKAGRDVKVLWMLRNLDDAQVYRYTLRELGDAMLMFTEAEIQALRREGKLLDLEAETRRAARRRRVVEVRGDQEHGFEVMIYQFATRGWNVLEDFFRLIELRGWDKTGIPDGQRNEFVLWFCVHAFLAMMGGPGNHQYMEVACALNYLVPHWGYNKIRGKLSAVYKRAQAMRDGYSFRKYGTKMYPLIYTPSNETLVERLRITDEELVQLNYIRTDSTYAAQKMRKRREEGMQSREEYLEIAERRRQEASFWRSQGLSWLEVGLRMGISEGAAKMILQRKR